MSRNCVVWSCFNKRGINSKERGISFHKFPRDLEVLAVWIRILRLYDYDPSRRLSICSVHFPPTCFTIGSKSRKTLRSHAVPSFINFPASENDFRAMQASRRSAVFKNGRKLGRPPKKREEMRYEYSDDEGQHVFSPPSSPEDGKLTIDLSPVPKHTDEDTISLRSHSAQSNLDPRGNPATRYTSTPEVVEIAVSPTTLSKLLKDEDPIQALQSMQPQSTYQAEPHNYTQNSNIETQINSNNSEAQITSSNDQMVTKSMMNSDSNNIQMSSNNMQAQINGNGMQMDSNSVQSSWSCNAQNSVQSVYSQDNSMASNVSSMNSNGQVQIQSSESVEEGNQISDVYCIAQQLDNMQQDSNLRERLAREGKEENSDEVDFLYCASKKSVHHLSVMSNNFTVTTTEFDAVYLEEILLSAKQMEDDTKIIKQEAKQQNGDPIESTQQQMQAPEMPLFSPPPVTPRKTQFEHFAEEDMCNPDLARNFYLCAKKVVSELHIAKTNLEYQNNALYIKFTNCQADCNKYKEGMNKLNVGMLTFQAQSQELQSRLHAMQNISRFIQPHNYQTEMEQPKKRKYTRAVDKIDKQKVGKASEKVKAQTFNVPPAKLAENMTNLPNYSTEVNITNNMVPNVNYNTNFRTNMPHSAYPRSQSVNPYLQNTPQPMPSPMLPNQNSPTTPLPSYTDLVAKTSLAGYTSTPFNNFYPAHYRPPNYYMGAQKYPMFPHCPTPYYPPQFQSEVPQPCQNVAQNFNDVNKEWAQHQNSTTE